MKVQTIRILLSNICNEISLCMDSGESVHYTVDCRYLEIQGTLKTIRYNRTSTYQICSIEEKQFEQPIFTNDYVI